MFCARKFSRHFQKIKSSHTISRLLAQIQISNVKSREEIFPEYIMNMNEMNGVFMIYNDKLISTLQFM